MRLFSVPGQKPVWLTQPFDLALYVIKSTHFIPITSIRLLGDLSWEFTWDGIDADYYRIILKGRELDKITETTYVFEGVGKYFEYPPPLEIVFEDELAATEINKPFLILQWYRDLKADFYEVQRLVSGSWETVYRIAEIGSMVYSYSTDYLEDLTQEDFRIISYNSAGQSSDPTLFSYFVVTPPEIGELSVSYNGQIIIEAVP